MIIKKQIILVAAVALFCACSAPRNDEQQNVDSAAVENNGAIAVDSSNSLSPAEKTDGWKLLFDGKTLSGWRFYKNKTNNSWEVADGMIHCKPFAENGTNERSDLITEEQFSNYELVFEWKISPQGNSGIIYRITEEFEHPYLSGPEFQLIDDEGYPGDLQEWQQTGACYDMFNPAKNNKINAPGEWNSSKLVVNGNHVEHWVNDVKLVEYELNSDEWKKRKEQSKWKDAKGYGQAAKGHISLQDHQNEVWFRNIKIKLL